MQFKYVCKFSMEQSSVQFDSKTISFTQGLPYFSPHRIAAADSRQNFQDDLDVSSSSDKMKRMKTCDVAEDV